jgi:hypothetical protein
MLRASSSPSPEPPSLVIQRSLGLELECTGLPITSVVKESRPTNRAKAKKNESIAGGYHWKMVYETTSEGQPVVEFVTSPPAEAGMQLLQGTVAMAKLAKEIASAGKKTFTNSGKIFTVEKQGSGEVDAAVQVTMGVPVGNVPSMLESGVNIGDTRPSLQKLKQLQKLDVKVPGGKTFSNLEPQSQGFILLAIDYIKRGYLPPTMRAQKPSEYKNEDEKTQWVEKGRPFVKGLYDFMIRTNMTAIFQSLPQAQQDRFTEIIGDKGNEQVAMKQEWVDWLLDQSVEKQHRSLGPNKGEIDLSKDPLISHKISGRDSPTQGPAKGEWLRALPERDLLSEKGFMGIGKLGQKTDVVSDTKEKAPVFEHREPYGSNMPVSKWFEVAEEQWKRYANIVQGKTVVTG